MEKEFNDLIKQNPKLEELSYSITLYLKFQDLGLATVNGTMMSIIFAINETLLLDKYGKQN